MTFNHLLNTSIKSNSSRNSFFINGKYYSYISLDNVISGIRAEIKNCLNESEKIVGVITNDDLETYATIFALWIEGKAYVPIDTSVPVERNLIIIKEAGIRTIFDSSQSFLFKKYQIIATLNLKAENRELPLKTFKGNEIAYLLFTSGTTGVPKGVSITFDNLLGFIKAFESLGMQIYPEDRFLQMFNLTFDLSVMSFLIPILKGACVYTVPKDEIKYLYIPHLMQERKLTAALMVPSILSHLRPHFGELEFPDLKHSLFCGEALPVDLTESWSRCVPNANIFNVYGPTESTIFCTQYVFSRIGHNKIHNGILSIGKPMPGTETIIVDENGHQLEVNKSGELCLSGNQLTPGYWRNEAKNKEAFFDILIGNCLKRFYKTGDLCYADNEGDIFYQGRLDHQIKIQGYRIELSEIEYHCKDFLRKINAVAIPFENKMGTTEIGLVLESAEFDTKALFEFLEKKMPSYMIPSQVHFINSLPLTVHGKINRKELKHLVDKQTWKNIEYVR